MKARELHTHTHRQTDRQRDRDAKFSDDKDTGEI